MEKILEDIQAKLTRMDTRTERIESIETKIDKVYSEMEVTRKEHQELKKQNKILEARIKMQEKHMEEMEREIRKRKIVIQGINEEEDESNLILYEKVRLLMREMGITINMEQEIEEMRRLGKKDTNKKGTRPILVEFGSLRKKKEVMSKKRNLKNTKVWITDDYPKTILEERKELLKYMIKAREEGCRANITYNKVIINGESYTVEQITQLQRQREEATDEEDLTNTAEDKEGKKRGRSTDEENENALKETRPSGTIPKRNRYWTQTMLAPHKKIEEGKEKTTDKSKPSTEEDAFEKEMQRITNTRQNQQQPAKN